MIYVMKLWQVLALREAEDWEFENLNKSEAGITIVALESGIDFGDLRLAMDNAEESILKQSDPVEFAKYGRCRDAEPGASEGGRVD